MLTKASCLEKGKRRTVVSDRTNTITTTSAARRRRNHVRLLRQRGFDVPGACVLPLSSSLPFSPACLSSLSLYADPTRPHRTPSPQARPSSSAGSCCCAYLQAVCAQIRAGAYATTSGDFLETIFTHREALFAFPQGHRACAAGFTELARDLETRAQRSAAVDGGGYQWRPDWDGDHEAVVAFRHEAWVIANAL